MKKRLLKGMTAALGLSYLCACPAFAGFALNNVSFATLFTAASLNPCMYTLDCGHFYVAGNVGVSHLFDKKTPQIPSSMDQNGPGWSAAIGYQFNSFLGTELGYTQYHESRETIGPVLGIPSSSTIAKTEHYASYLAGTLRYPLFCRFSALAKLGLAYSYANKIYLLGPSASSGAVSAYYGLGLTYSVTQRVDFVGQWMRVRGNDATGSSDLYSLGATFAIV